MSNNGPDIQVGLSDELAAFVVENCDANIVYGLKVLQSLPRDSAIKIVAQMEKFKALKAATETAIREAGL